MKKTIVILILACCLSVGCGSRDCGFESPVSEIVGDDVTTVSVSHIVSGQMTEWVISGEAVEAFRTWINGLECRREQFEDGNTPGDMDGGEAYGFVFAGENKSEFSYIINGPNDCYLLMEGEWYSVRNPSDPPVMEESASVRSEKPPLLTVISDETTHDALLGTYSWQHVNGDGTSTGIEVDHAHPLDCEAWLPPLETTSQTVVLRFSEEPDRIVSIRCWSDENWSDPTAESEDITVMGNEIELKIGGYIYEVTAEWNKDSGYGGTAYYSFYVKLSE